MLRVVINPSIITISHLGARVGLIRQLRSGILIIFFVQRLYTIGVNNKFRQSPFGLKKTKFFVVYVSTT